MVKWMKENEQSRAAKGDVGWSVAPDRLRSFAMLRMTPAAGESPRRGIKGVPPPPIETIRLVLRRGGVSAVDHFKSFRQFE